MAYSKAVAYGIKAYGAVNMNAPLARPVWRQKHAEIRQSGAKRTFVTGRFECYVTERCRTGLMAL